ncbi:MAG: cyanoexosortase A system-associated protein [Leptolyngbyaceae bacterium]|nr:cyanoexosortase A system-associated protein [Leptolyngbyaceae bacterium]
MSQGWPQWRGFVLGVTCSSILLVLARVTFAPSLGTSSPYEFPDTVPLPHWQFQGSSALSLPTRLNNDGTPVPWFGQQYRYQQPQTTLTIDMYYLPTSLGNMQNDLQGTSPLFAENTSPPWMKARQGTTGFYGLFHTPDQAYLTACINPRGASTVTADQFVHNRNTHDLQIQRWFPVLIGLEDLRDWRCLWAQLSISLKGTTAVQADQLLETAWQDWYLWWQGRFPKP